MYSPIEQVLDHVTVDISTKSLSASDNANEGVHKRRGGYVSYFKKSKRGTLVDRLQSIRKTSESSDSLSLLDISI